MEKVICVLLVVFLYGCFCKILLNDVSGQWKFSPPINKGDPPATFDWSHYGVVSPVKDQGNCSAGWAFSIVAAMESQLNIYYHLHYIPLSEQFLIDCNKINAGCGYADILSVCSDVIVGVNGISINETYRPYDGHKEQCNASAVHLLILAAGFEKIQSESDIKAHLYQYGPLSASINAASMEKYKPNSTRHGIDVPSDEDCPPHDLNHAVLIVGYDEYVSEDKNETIPYWIIKNSWGTNWGHDGYYYLVRGRNACGIGNNVGLLFI